MLEGPPLHIHQELVTNLETALRQRVLHASPIRVLSTRNNKLSEVAQDIDGTRFVRRSYGQTEVARIEQVGLTFGEAWDETHKMFSRVDINMVPSTVFYPPSSESQFPVVVASEYVEGVGVVTSVDIEMKTRLATSLGKILLEPSGYYPSFEVFAQDMFKVGRDRAGTSRLVLIDVDPYVVDQEKLLLNEEARDVWYAAYIRHVSDLLWGSWCQPSERGIVIAAFLRSLAPCLAAFSKRFDSFNSSRTFDALMKAHSRAQGFDLRGL